MGSEFSPVTTETDAVSSGSGPSSPDPDDDSQQLLDLIYGSLASQAVRAIADLRIADHLGDGALTSDEIAVREGSNPATTYRLMRAGAAFGLLKENPDGTFSGTDLSRPLRTDAPCSLRPLALSMTSSPHWMAWTEFTASVRSGRSQASAVLGTDIFTYFEQHPAEGRDFSAAMTSATAYWTDAVAQLIDTTGVQRAVDVGGAHGELLRRLQHANPTLRGVVFDRPQVLISAGAEAAQAGFANRTEFVAGDFFTLVPQGDLYLLKFILHDWSDYQCIEILRRCRESMVAGGRLVVIEFLVDASEIPSRMATYSDLQMLLLLSGRERSLEEFDILFTAAGLRRVSIKPLRHPQVVIEAVAL